MTDYAALLRAALLRVLKSIEKMTQINHGRSEQTANRSAGQLFSKRWQHKRMK